MTNVRRPIHLHLRSPSSSAPSIGSPKALSPAADSLPSQILPHLFVGNQEQTNRETVNRLNISYILSLGLLPLISSSVSPTSPTYSNNTSHSNRTTNKHYHSSHQQISLPSRNASKDFKIRIRTNAAPPQQQTLNSPMSPQTTSTLLIGGACSGAQQRSNVATIHPQTPMRDENKGVKQIRWIQCKCINIADSSEQILSKFFDEAHRFIDEARGKKCNILVHCQAGISRSPTFAIAYLMRVSSLPLQDAYNLVKQCRPQTDPNLSFMGQLMLYEKSLEAGKSSSVVTKCVSQSKQQQQRKSLTQDTKSSS